MSNPTRQLRVHLREYPRSIVAVALLAMATWWGIGLPYSLFASLLDSPQRAWTLSGPIEPRSRPQAGTRIALSLPVDDPTTSSGGDGGRMASVG